jgi:hypothetical protein
MGLNYLVLCYATTSAVRLCTVSLCNLHGAGTYTSSNRCIHCIGIGNQLDVWVTSKFLEIHNDSTGN